MALCGVCGVCRVWPRPSRAPYHPPAGGGAPAQAGEKNPAKGRTPRHQGHCSRGVSLPDAPWCALVSSRSWLHTALAGACWKTHASLLTRSSEAVHISRCGQAASWPRCIPAPPLPPRPGALVLPDRQTRRHFPTLPGGVPRKKLSVCAGGSGGGDVLTPGLHRTTAFWAALTGEGQA